MIELIEKYNKQGIPTIFYSKEDPVNFHLFKSLAKHCQYILQQRLSRKIIRVTGNKMFMYYSLVLTP